jgi:hypothetical protein
VAASSNGAKGLPEVASDLWELTTTYAKQQTIDPLKGLGRFLAFGLAGAVSLGIGTILLALALLRALQTETGSTFTGNLSWIPYLIVVVVGAALIALAISRVGARKGPEA